MPLQNNKFMRSRAQNKLIQHSVIISYVIISLDVITLLCYYIFDKMTILLLLTFLLNLYVTLSHDTITIPMTICQQGMTTLTKIIYQISIKLDLYMCETHPYICLCFFFLWQIIKCTFHPKPSLSHFYQTWITTSWSGAATLESYIASHVNQQSINRSDKRFSLNQS